MSIIVTFEMPDLKRGFQKKFKEAVAQAMQNYRKKFLPEHFKESAFSRYPSDYAQSGKKKSSLKKRNRNSKIRDTFKKMSHFERVALRRRLKKENSQINRKQSKSNKPLVKSGLLKDAALNGNPRFTGRADNLKLVISVPAYYSFQSTKFNKVNALEAKVSEEENFLAAEIDKLIDKNWLKKPKRR